MYRLKPHIIVVICFCCMATNFPQTVKSTNNKSSASYVNNKKKDNHNLIKYNNLLLPLKNIMIDLITPASKISETELLTLKNFPNLNLNILVSSSHNNILPFLASSDEERLKQLKEALYNNPNNIIWCARGGYGSARLIDELFKLPKPAKEKIFIGYSDITALHLFLTQQWGWKTIHAAVPVELLMPEKDKNNFTLLAELINHEKTSCSLNDLQPLNLTAKEIKEPISGITTGGNLTLLQTSIGTKWQIDSNNKILFIEDVSLLGYQVDRALHHLLQAGIFNNAKAIIFGNFSKGDELIWITIEDFCNTKLSIPAFKSDQFGHGKINRPIIYNTKGEITNKNEKYQQLIMYLE